ncbi:unnamed protein product [Chrysoparadoxa australica]
MGNRPGKSRPKKATAAPPPPPPPPAACTQAPAPPQPPSHTETSKGNSTDSNSDPKAVPSRTFTDSLKHGKLLEAYNVETIELGHGQYGRVHKCSSKKTGEELALKSILKSRVGKMDTIKREIEILTLVDHPNVIKLVDVFEDEHYLHLVTELCTGGELFDRIIARSESDEGRYSERDAAIIIRKILLGLRYCHVEHNICHRDLKPDNFLFKGPEEDAELKIIDFGLSRFEESQQLMTTRVGTPYYMAPEVLKRNYTLACDLWSVGVVCYILLCGFPPFYGDTDQEIFAGVLLGEFDFPSPEWDSVSDAAKNFISKLLVTEPSKRLTAQEALEHPWITKDYDAVPPAVLPEDMKQRISYRLRRFVGMNKLKKVALNVIAQRLAETEAIQMRAVFEDLDVDKDGSISVTELHSVIDQAQVTYLFHWLDAILRGVDIDGSESIDIGEFLAATISHSLSVREDLMKHAFRYFDLEGTGVITSVDLIKIFGDKGQAEAIMGEIDENADGSIQYSEFRDMMLRKH